MLSTSSSPIALTHLEMSILFGKFLLHQSILLPARLPWLGLPEMNTTKTVAYLPVQTLFQRKITSIGAIEDGGNLRGTRHKELNSLSVGEARQGRDENGRSDHYYCHSQNKARKRVDDDNRHQEGDNNEPGDQCTGQVPQQSYRKYGYVRIA